jgi:hypothetical protein
MQTPVDSIPKFMYPYLCATAGVVGSMPYINFSTIFDSPFKHLLFKAKMITGLPLFAFYGVERYVAGIVPTTGTTGLISIWLQEDFQKFQSRPLSVFQKVVNTFCASSTVIVARSYIEMYFMRMSERQRFQKTIKIMVVSEGLSSVSLFVFTPEIDRRINSPIIASFLGAAITSPLTYFLTVSRIEYLESNCSVPQSVSRAVRNPGFYRQMMHHNISLSLFCLAANELNKFLNPNINRK